MQTLTGKQREMQQREEKILAAAREMMLQGGYHGINMDRIGTALGYSKGTIYNHFPCKEEIIMALVIESLQKRADYFERGANYRGRSRERMVGIGIAAEIFIRLHPYHHNMEQICRASSIFEKTSEKRRSSMRACEGRCMGITSGIVRDGIVAGDLELPPTTNPEDVVFGLWSMSYGSFAIIANGEPVEDLGVTDAREALWRNYHALLDGYGWRPLSTEYGYGSVRESIITNLFAKEAQAAA